MKLKAPFPWFGGKSRVAYIAWDRFGDVSNYVEPFAGSLAVLLGRPTEPRVETVNDIDCVAPDTRLLKSDLTWTRAGDVAVGDCLLGFDESNGEARVGLSLYGRKHRAVGLVAKELLGEQEVVAIQTDCRTFIAEGLASHNCMIANFWRALAADPEAVAHHADWPVNEADLHARHLWLVNREEFRERMKTDPDHYDARIAGWWVWGISQWIGGGWCATEGPIKSRDRADASPRRGRPDVKNQGVSAKRPLLSGHSGSRGVHQKMPQVQRGWGFGVNSKDQVEPTSGLLSWFLALQQRLRRVRVCCGDWTRVLGPAVTTCIGTTAVFLDPPYSVEDRADVYNHESRDVSHAVCEWALAHGSDPGLRIALCGYAGEHAMPASWECVAWKSSGGYGSQGTGAGRDNAGRERVWFSPGCLSAPLFQQPTVHSVVEVPR
jgi:hypothetical protein